MWVLRLSQKGEMIWQKTYGGKEVEKGISITETKNNEIMLIEKLQVLERGKRYLDCKNRFKWPRTMEQNH